MYWNVMVIVLCSIVLLCIIWKEIKRSNKSWLAVRIVTSAFAVISLACLAIPVSVHQKQKTASSDVTFLLTEGFNSDSVQKILSINKRAKIFTTQKNISPLKAIYITDVSALKEFSVIHIFGYGLDENDLRLLHDIPVVFHPGVVKNTITGIGWTQELTLGEPLVVQGKFNNTNAKPVKITLSGFNTNFDSITLAANQMAYFALHTNLKHLDKAICQVNVLSGKDTIEKEPVPVEVKAVQPFNILLLAASPDFENKFLIRWLAKNEYKFAARTRISKDKYARKYVNIPAVSTDRISSSLLEKFDVIIADAAELATLPATDIATIRSYVANKGLGLLVKADSAGNSHPFYLNSFPLTEIKDSIQHRVTLNLMDITDTASALKIEQPIYIRHVEGTQSLAKDQLMRTVVNSKIYGLGKVILTTIPNTYTWQLSGNDKDYSSYWSRILAKAAKKNTLQEVWEVTPALPQKNQETHIKLQTPEAFIPQVQTEKDKVYMAQNYYVPYEWNGTCWPKKTGWQSLTEGKGASYSWYVYDDNDWKGIKALERINATKKYANSHRYKPASHPVASIKTRTEIPKIYFFILFIICAGFLWFEKKFRDR